MNRTGHDFPGCHDPQPFSPPGLPTAIITVSI